MPNGPLKFEDIMKLSALSNKDLLAEGILYNCSAYVEKNEEGQWEAKGNCTEQGLIRFLLEEGVPCDNMIRAKNNPRQDGSSAIVASIPFSSVYKKGFTALLHPT